MTLFIRLIFISIYLFTAQSLSAQERHEYSSNQSHYNIKASIQLDTGVIEANVKMYLTRDESTDTLRFLIHEDLLPVTIKSPFREIDVFPMTIERPLQEMKSVESETKQSMEHIKEVIIPAEDVRGNEDGFLLDWSYQGELKNENLTMGHAAITPKWTELPLEAMWVPSLYPFKKYTYTAEIELPRKYELVSSGDFYLDDGRWKIKSSRKAMDAVIIASDQMKTKTTSILDDKTLNVRYIDTKEATVDFIIEESQRIFENYNGYLPLDYIEDEINIAISPLEDITVQNYSRNNLIAIGKDYGPGRTLFYLLSHESAHFWWILAENPKTKDNFLNEAFAQFFARYQIKEKYGQKVFEDYLRRARENAEKVPPADKLTESDIRGFSYVKGPVLLFDLQQKMSDTDFKHFVNILLEKKVGTFDQMLTELENISSEPTYDWFISELYY